MDISLLEDQSGCNPTPLVAIRRHWLQSDTLGCNPTPLVVAIRVPNWWLQSASPGVCGCNPNPLVAIRPSPPSGTCPLDSPWHGRVQWLVFSSPYVWRIFIFLCSIVWVCALEAMLPFKHVANAATPSRSCPTSFQSKPCASRNCWVCLSGET